MLDHPHQPCLLLSAYFCVNDRERVKKGQMADVSLRCINYSFNRDKNRYEAENKDSQSDQSWMKIMIVLLYTYLWQEK